MTRQDDIARDREYDAQELSDRMENMSNEGHGFPRPIRDADNALLECAKLLRVLTDTLTKIVAGSIDFRVDVRLWPLGIDGHFEVRK